jgi:hypothetical protein
MLRLDLPGLTAHADLIVAGHVTAATSAWTQAHKAIYTDVSITVTRGLAGSAKVGDTISVRCEGGSVDGIGMKVYGAAGFTPGEDVVVFLEQRGSYRYVVGMSQGKLEVVPDAKGVLRLRRNLSEVAFLPGQPAPSGPSLASITTVDELAQAVARLRAAHAR